MTAQPMTLMSDEEIARYGKDPDAGFGALQTDRGALPLRSMDVDARVAGVVAAIELAQTFVNTTGGPVEAAYIFPLPDRAAVHRFRMEVAGRVVEGVVEERGEAREQYDAAIAAGHRASIAEEERPGVFTLRVGNLMPGEAATVRLSLVGPLPVDDGEVMFRFPLVVAPRYIPGAALGGEQAGLGTASDTDLVPDASRISPPVRVRLPGYAAPVRLGIRVALADHTVRDVASSLHAVTAAHADANVIEIQPGEKLDRDFILRWRIDPPGAQVASSLVTVPDGEGTNEGVFMLTLVPPAGATVAAKPRDIVFVIDRSGSMDGWKMVAARRAAARMIDTLSARDRFCAIAFDTAVELVPASGLVDATDRNRFRAVEALAKIEARGGTEMAQPLTAAARMLAGGTLDRERVIVLVTDGQVGNEDQILRELAPALKNVKMFALGIDQAVNAAFLRRLASAGGGLCELVESEDRIDAVMAKVHRRIGTPLATELAIAGSGLDVDASTISPKKLPDVYAGAPVVVFGRYRGSPNGGALEVTSTMLGEPSRERVAATALTDVGVGRAWLAASWARARIRDLEDAYAASPQPSIAAQIVQLSKSHRVLSRFTAFLAIDRSAVANPGGEQKQIVQPVESPAGWEHRGPSGGQPHFANLSQGFGGAGAPTGPMPQPRPLGAPPVVYARAAAAPMGGAMAPGGAPPPPPQAPMRTMMSPAAAPPERSKRAAMPSTPAPVSRPRAPEPKKDEAAAEGMPSLAEKSAPSDAYMKLLASLARELASRAAGADLASLRIVRQRLVEWIEDVRSVGEGTAVADAVERLVQRLSASFATTSYGAEAALVAVELASLAAGSPPPAPPKKSRLAFWK